MICSLRGRLLARSANSELFIEVSGVGYKVHATSFTVANLSPVELRCFHTCTSCCA